MTVETVELSVEIRSYDAAHRIAVSLLKWLYNKRFHDVQDRLVNKILTRGYPRSVRVAVELPQKLAYRMRMRPQCATVERTPRQLGGLSISGTLRVAGLQSAGKPADPDANLDELDRVAKSLAGQADLLITPELFVTGYDIGDRLRELVSVGHLESVRSIAERNKLAIIVGLAEEGPVGALHNSAVFIDERGVVRGRHRKTHLFGEIDRAYFTPGSQPATVVQYRGVQVGVMICYDVEFPENVRMAALAGADLLAVPTAQMEPFEFVADVVVRARAWENQIYLAYINHDGAENATTYVGRSSIVGPDGGVLDRIESGTGTIIAEIDTEVVRAAQRANPYLTDVRPELNAPLVAPPAPRPAWPN